MSEWMVGLYEDDHDQAFIGVKGGSICWIDNLTRRQATMIVEAHNTLEARLSKMEESNRVAIKIIALARSLAVQPIWIEKVEEALAGESDV